MSKIKEFFSGLTIISIIGLLLSCIIVLCSHFRIIIPSIIILPILVPCYITTFVTGIKKNKYGLCFLRCLFWLFIVVGAIEVAFYLICNEIMSDRIDDQLLCIEIFLGIINLMLGFWLILSFFISKEIKEYFQTVENNPETNAAFNT